MPPTEPNERTRLIAPCPRDGPEPSSGAEFPSPRWGGAGDEGRGGSRNSPPPTLPIEGEGSAGWPILNSSDAGSGRFGRLAGLLAAFLADLALRRALEIEAVKVDRLEQ